MIKWTHNTIQLLELFKFEQFNIIQLITRSSPPVPIHFLKLRSSFFTGKQNTNEFTIFTSSSKWRNRPSISSLSNLSDDFTEVSDQFFNRGIIKRQTCSSVASRQLTRRFGATSNSRRPQGSLQGLQREPAFAKTLCVILMEDFEVFLLSRTAAMSGGAMPVPSPGPSGRVNWRWRAPIWKWRFTSIIEFVHDYGVWIFFIWIVIHNRCWEHIKIVY